MLASRYVIIDKVAAATGRQNRDRAARQARTYAQIHATRTDFSLRENNEYMNGQDYMKMKKIADHSFWLE